MKLKIEIDMANAAFENSGEAARILSELAGKLGDWSHANAFKMGLRDINGNMVGRAEVFSPGVHARRMSKAA